MAKSGVSTFRSDMLSKARDVLTETVRSTPLTSAPDAALIGVDFRVQDGELYGVGDGGGVYRIDTASAAATLVNRLTEPLVGASFGVDFNPAADRLRRLRVDGIDVSGCAAAAWRQG